MNTIELTFCYNDVITKFKLDVVRCNMDDMGIFEGCKTDEVIHGFISDCEWWIAVGIDLKMDGMIKVVAE